MKQVEIEGESIDEAIEKALGLLGVERDKVAVDILTEATKGLLGFGRQNARVRVALRESVVAESLPAAASEPTEERASATNEPADDRRPVTTDEPLVTDERYNKVATTSKEILAEILTLMGVSAEVETKRAGKDVSEVVLNIKGESSGLLIGRRGQTLEALQYILSRIVAERLGPEGPQPIVDTENYRMRRVRTLEDMALRMGEKAKRSRKTMGIDALSARDRRIIHLTLQDDPWLTTKSLGQGPYRRLLIIPEGDRKEQDTQA